MSRTLKADHRLVQPRPEHYVDGENGQRVLVGPFTRQQRNRWFKANISLYMKRHPEASQKQANKKTFYKWRNVVFAAISDEARNPKPNSKGTTKP